MLTNGRRCPSCNEVVVEGSKFCPYCGAKLENQEVQPAPAKVTILCPNCGAQIEANSAFCPECGNKIDLLMNEQENEARHAEKASGQEADVSHYRTDASVPTSQSNTGAGIPANQIGADAGMPASQSGNNVPESAFASGYQNAKGAAQPTYEYNMGMPDNTANAGIPWGELPNNQPTMNESQKSKKKSTAIKILTGVSAAVVVLIAAFAGFLFFSGRKKTNNPYIMYIKDKELNLSHISKIKPYELTSKLLLENEDIDDDEFFASDYTEYYMFLLSYGYIHFSDDYRYLFYPDKLGDEGVTIYWRDLSAKESGESHKIDSGEIYNTTISKDGSKLFYVKGSENKLYVYDRAKDEKTRLDDNVNSVYINDDGNYIIYTRDDDGESVIYEMSISGKEPKKNKIDSEASIVKAFPNSKKVFYLKDDSLYVKENKKDKIKIASDVTRVLSVVDEKSVYYLKSENISNTLDMFIDDDYAETDRDIVEPAYPSYPEEPQYPDQDDYTYSQWNYSYWGYEYNEDLGEWGYWSQEVDWDRYNAAVEQYENDYDKWEEECNRLNDEYDTAYRLYEEKLSRDMLREELKSDYNAITYSKYTLYYWSDGTETEIVRDVAYDNTNTGLLAVSTKVPAAVYQKYSETEMAALKLSDLIATNGYDTALIYSDVMDNLENARVKQNDIFIAYKGKEYKLAAENAAKWNISDDGTIYFIDEYDLDDNAGIFKSVKVSDNGIGSPVAVDKDVSDYNLFDGGKIIYCKDMKDGSGEIYQGGKKLASDVYFESLYSFEDSGTLFYLVDYDQDDKEGTLYCRMGDEQTKIADDVHQYVPVNEEKVVYLKDYSTEKNRGELVIYRGGKKRDTIDNDVSYIFNLDGNNQILYDLGLLAD